MRIKPLSLKVLLLVLLPSLSFLNASKVSAETFNTLDAVQASFSLDCIDYCIVGICVHIICTPFGCSLDYSPRIAHNWPELVVSVYDDVSEQPYEEYQEFQKNLLESVANFGADLALPERVGSTAVRFKNVSIIGHPIMLVANSGSTGSTGGGSTGGNGNSASFGQQQEPETPEEWSEQQTVNSQVGGMDSEISSGLSGVTGSSAFEGFCPAQVQAFMPYYESTIDMFEWRFSVIDRIVAVSNNAHIFGNREIGSMDSLNPIGENTWGAVYPRNGFILQTEDPKAAAVIAQRAVDVVTRNDMWRLKIQPPIDESDEKKGLWQMISPKKDTTCGPFGSSDADWSEGRNPDGLGQYGWNYWGRYSCCWEKWPLLTVIPITPICIS